VFSEHTPLSMLRCSLLPLLVPQRRIFKAIGTFEIRCDRRILKDKVSNGLLGER